VSPTNLWHQDSEEFHTDNSLEKTIFTYQVYLHVLFYKYFIILYLHIKLTIFQSPSHIKISIPELFFGMPLKETGIKRYSVHPRQRIVQYAITIFMKRLVPQ